MKSMQNIIKIINKFDVFNVNFSFKNDLSIILYYIGIAECSSINLDGIKLVQSAEVNGNKPIVEHLYKAKPKDNNCNDKYINLGKCISTPSSFAKTEKNSLTPNIAFNGFINAIPVIIILNICIDEPDIHNINAVVNKFFPGL